MRKLVVLLVLLLLIGLVGYWYLRGPREEKPQRRQDTVLAFDGFGGKLNLDWDILHPDPTHYSLTKKPGSLTITTQQGGFAREAQDYKNLFLIDCPAAIGQDFQLTTCISSFSPVADWSQAGLILYKDDDNYLNFVYAWRSFLPGRLLTVGIEWEGIATRVFFEAHRGLEKLWLRVTKRGNRYTFSTSLDGKTFLLLRYPIRDSWRVFGRDLAWGDGSVRRVGLVAENGAGSTAAEVDASFDFFEVSAVPDEPPATGNGEIVVPQENLRIPKEMQACAANLRKIYAAIKRHQKDIGELPEWLSDLVPLYVSADTLLCPSDPAPSYGLNPDPKVPCSYGYQFSSGRVPSDWGLPPGTIYRDFKTQQVSVFGDVVPMVRCRGHYVITVLNLSVGGQVYWSPGAWEEMFIPGYRRDTQLTAAEAPERGRDPNLSKLPGIRRLAARGWKASWSPDGTRVVFGNAQGEGLQLLDLETGETTDLTSLGKDPAWSPDGRYIAYVNEPEFNVFQSEEVWLMRPTGESPRKIMDGGFPLWSADGKTLFVDSRRKGRIVAIDVDNPDAEPKVFFDRTLSWFPAISPDGRRIAFGARGDLVVVDRETRQRVMTWEVPGSPGVWPAWSPDGNLIAFGGFDDDPFGLWVIDMKTKEAIQIAKGCYTMPAWSKDGSKLAFDFRSGNTREVWMVETKALATLKPSRLPPYEPTVDVRAGTADADQGLGEALAFDDFGGKLSLDWDILHPDATHYSLTKKPGTLTITTQRGGFASRAQDYKNLFLIDRPVAAEGDFQLTTCVCSFKPVADWNQAGLICYNDDDNYLKFVYEWDVALGGRIFTIGFESEGRHPTVKFRAHREFEKVWLRVTKRGNRYAFFISLDGKTFLRLMYPIQNPYGRFHRDLMWGDGFVGWVGIFAKNGSGSTAPELDASFDFFEVRRVRAVPAKSLPAAAAKFFVPQENLKIPKEMQACAANLRKIYAAIKRYEKDKSELPEWLSDLVPSYLNPDMLLCRDNPEQRSPYYPDPNLPCSYTYEFSWAPVPRAWDPTGRTLCRDWKHREIQVFGEVVPLVRCFHHGGATVLNISVRGQVYWSPPAWESMFIPGYRLGGQLRAGETFAGGRDPNLSKLPGLRRLAARGFKASWSPDGTRVVFGKGKGEGLQLFNLETEKTTDLTPLGKDPAWSPDGRYIAYVNEPEFNVFQSEEVWLMRPTGESARKIMDGGFPNWSADGKTLFVHSRKERQNRGH